MVRKSGISLFLAIYILTFMFAACGSSLACGEKNAQKNTKEGKAVLIFDKEVVKKMLIEDGYKEKDVEIEIISLSKTDARLQTVLDTYLFDRTISSDFNVEGLTMKIVMEKFGCNFWSALDFMETYLDDPKGAKLLIDAPPFLYRTRHR